MTTPIAAGNDGASARIYGAADWLALAAAPVFAVMAWAASGDAMALCSSGSGLLPIGSMVWMYLLMSLFHLPPWLKLASRRCAAVHPFCKRTEGD